MEPDNNPSPQEYDPKPDPVGGSPPQPFKGSLEHLKKQAPPTGPVPLAYGHARYPTPHAAPAFGAQCFLGFMFWVGAVVLAAVFLFGTNSNAFFSGIGRIGLLVELGGVIGFSVWLRVKHGWRGFIPGVLIGCGLTCLVPIGIIAVVCSGHPL